jgi:ribosomal protein S27E
MLDPRTIEALQRMDREGAVELDDLSTARRLVRYGFATRDSDNRLVISDHGLLRLEDWERKRNLAARGRRTDTDRWTCTGKRVGRHYSYQCNKCGNTRMMAPNSVWLAQCNKCCDETHPAEPGREIHGFRLTGEVLRRARRSEDRYTVECVECGQEGRKTMWELETRRNGCKRCSMRDHARKMVERNNCIIGHDYAHWHVIGVTPHSRTSHRSFEVRCTACGTEILMNSPAILSGRACRNCERIERDKQRDADVMSRTYGPWTPICKEPTRNSSGAQLWRFRCTQGHERVTPLKNVKGVKYCLRCKHEGSPDNAYQVGDKVNGRKILSIDTTDCVTVVCPKGHESTGKMYNMRHHGCRVCSFEEQRKQRS